MIKSFRNFLVLIPMLMFVFFENRQTVSFNYAELDSCGTNQFYFTNSSSYPSSVYYHWNFTGSVDSYIPSLSSLNSYDARAKYPVGTFIVILNVYANNTMTTLYKAIVNLQSISNGVYFVKVATKNGNANKRIVIRK